MAPKRWSWSVGEYGYRVTVEERAPGSNLRLRWWDSMAKKFRHESLGHKDRDEGKKEARCRAAARLEEKDALARGTVTLRAVFTAYRDHVSLYRKHLSQTREDGRRMALWLAFLGADRDVNSIDFATLATFCRARKAGSIVVPGRSLRKNVSDRTVQMDVNFLKTCLTWATRYAPDGRPILEQNPVAGFQAPTPRQRKRPIATWERFQKVRAVADSVDAQGLFGLFLDLVEGTGWRVSAICDLWAGDVDLARSSSAPFGRLHKRGEMDKTGADEWVPINGTVRGALEALLALSRRSEHSPLFPTVRKKRSGKRGSWTRYYAASLLTRAEKKAGLEPLDGGDFHPYRRKWATERKGHPIEDVMKAGSWKSRQALEESYLQADEESTLAVVLEEKKLRKAE